MARPLQLLHDVQKVTAPALALVAMLAPFDIGLIDILSVSIPATFLGCFLGACYASRMGKDLDKDPVYLERVKNGEVPPIVHHDPNEQKAFSREAKLSVALFIFTAIAIVLFGVIPELRPMLPTAKGELARLSMTNTIEIVMMLMGVIILLSCKVKATEVINMSVFKQGMMGVFCIFAAVGTGLALAQFII